MSLINVNNIIKYLINDVHNDNINETALIVRCSEIL